MTRGAKWTFMVYMGGDNSRSEASDSELNKMRRVGSTSEINVLVQRDRAGNQGTQRFLIQTSGNDMVQSLGETNSGDPNVLLEFVSWSCANYPADRYALILWDQGRGWVPAEIDRIAHAIGAQDYAVRESQERVASPLGSAFFSTTIEVVLSQPTVAERAILSDDGSCYALDILELGRTLQTITHMLGRPLDLLGMDASLRCSLEVAFQLRPFVRYFVASEMKLPVEGWPYEAVLSKLVTDPDLYTSAFASHVVEAYVKHFRDIDPIGPEYSISLAALDLAEIGLLTAPLDDLADTLIAQMPKMQSILWTAQRKSASFFNHTLWDIADLCAELAKLTTRNPVRHSIAAVQASLCPGVGSFIVASAHRGAFVEHCGGVSIYLPPLIAVSRHYQDLDFAKEHRWLSMLHAYQAE